MGFFEKLKAGLKKTKDAVFKQVNDIFKHFVSVDEDMLEELEEALIAADVGFEATEEIIEKLRDTIKENRIRAIPRTLCPPPRFNISRSKSVPP